VRIFETNNEERERKGKKGREASLLFSYGHSEKRKQQRFRDV